MNEARWNGPLDLAGQAVLLTLDQVPQPLKPDPTDLRARDMDRRQWRIERTGHLDIVESHNRDVLRDRQATLDDRSVGANCRLIAHSNHRRGWLGQIEQDLHLAVTLFLRMGDTRRHEFFSWPDSRLLEREHEAGQPLA